jgi:Uma2 family endonuclease
MTAATPDRMMTADELADLPDDGMLYELSRGMLVCMSPSSYGPSRIAGRILAKMATFIDEHELGDYGSAEGGFKLASDPDTVRAPDIWFVRKERVPEGANPEGFYDGPPDLAVEVLSPSDRFHQIAMKVRDYLDAGTPLIWVLDPKGRLAAVFRPGAPVRFIDADGVLDGEDILPGFTLPIESILR